MAEFAMLADR